MQTASADRQLTPEEIDEVFRYPTCSVEQAAGVLGIGRGQAYRAVNNGEIDAITIGRRKLVRTKALRRMIDDGVDAA